MFITFECGIYYMTQKMHWIEVGIKLLHTTAATARVIDVL